MTSNKYLVAHILTCLMLACSMLLLLSFFTRAMAQGKEKISITPVGLGWSKNSVNAVIFRKNSITSINGTQYTAYYDERGRVVIGKRTLGEQKWQLAVTPYIGNVADAHNAISMMVDGSGYLHLSWDHHNGALNNQRFYLIFRDEERANYVSVAVVSAQNEIEMIDVYKKDVGAWEPSFDTALWNDKKILHLYVQHVEQADGEGKTDFPLQMVSVLEWKP